VKAHAARGNLMIDMQIAYRVAKNMQAKYEIKVQVIRSKKQAPRFYVNFPLPLAAALDLEAGEPVQWRLLGRGELRLLRRSWRKVRQKTKK
jgi:hypothetical protein